MSQRELRDRVEDRTARLAGAGHQDHARPFAGAHEDVLGVGRAVDEIPRAKPALFPLDEE